MWYMVLVLRTVDPELYYEFLRGKATDAEVVDRIFSRSPELREIQQRNDGCVFESLIVLAAEEVSGDEEEGIDSPLLRRYQEQVQDETRDPKTRKHARTVLQRFEVLGNGRVNLSYGPFARFGFKHSVARIELLSPGLIGEGVGAAALRP